MDFCLLCVTLSAARKSNETGSLRFLVFISMSPARVLMAVNIPWEDSRILLCLLNQPCPCSQVQDRHYNCWPSTSSRPQVCSREKPSARRGNRQVLTQLKEEFRELLLPRRALGNEEDQSQLWLKALWIYFTDTLKAILSCTKDFTCPQRAPSLCPIVALKMDAAANFLITAIFFFQLNSRAKYHPARVAWGNHQREVCTLTCLLGLSKAHRLERFGLKFPQDLFHLWICSLSLCHWIVLCITKYFK